VRIDLRFQRAKLGLLDTGRKPQPFEAEAVVTIEQVVEKIEAQPAAEEKAAVDPARHKQRDGAVLLGERSPVQSETDAITQQAPDERQSGCESENARQQRPPAEILPTPPDEVTS
jgi:hypothetical protein